MQRAFGPSSVMAGADTGQLAKFPAEMSLIRVAELGGEIAQARLQLQGEPPCYFVEALNPEVVLRRQTHRRSEQSDEVFGAEAR